MLEKQKILIVDDDENIAELVSLYLTKECFGTKIANDGEAALAAAKAYQPDLVLLDIMLPGIDGYEVLRELRKTSSIPVILLSAKGETFDKVLGLELGADDYIMKPFAMTVLLAKIQALLRRNKQTADAEEIMWDHNSFNPLTNILTNGNGTAQLTPTEGAMLQVLLSHRNKTVSKEQLLQWLWQGGKYLNENTLNVNISRLRTKLSTIGLRQCIHTERGLGYRLVENNE